MKDIKILIVGLGNIGSSLAKGLLEQGYDNNNLYSIDNGNNQNAQRLGVNMINNLAELTEVDVVIFAVKPNVLLEILPNYQQFSNSLFISVAAGITTQNIQNGLGERYKIVRAMPNTPVSIGCGMTGMFANPHVAEQDKKIAEQLFSTVGEVAWVDLEAMLDAVTAISGSGPAYFFLLAECLANSGEQLGLPPVLANQLAIQTALGAGKLLANGELSAQELREMVTSPQGTTEAAIQSFMQDDLPHTIYKGVVAANSIAKKMSQ